MADKKRKQSSMPVAVAPVHAEPPVIEPGQHAQAAMVAEAAYYRAQKRGFAPGGELDDWLAAEREIRSAVSAGPPG